MKTNRPYRKFQLQKQRIEELEKQNSRFKRIYSEYELMSEELWTFENEKGNSLPDDFLNSIQLQKAFLEDEIQDWLIDEEAHRNKNF